MFRPVTHHAHGPAGSRRFSCAVLCVCLCLTLPAAVAAPETGAAKAQPQKQIQKQARKVEMPRRGMSMKQVEKKFGKPIKVIPPTGPTSKARPPITRWVYDDYIVYFERNLVIHSAKPRDPEKFRKLKESATAKNTPDPDAHR